MRYVFFPIINSLLVERAWAMNLVWWYISSHERVASCWWLRRCYMCRKTPSVNGMFNTICFQLPLQRTCLCYGFCSLWNGHSHYQNFISTILYMKVNKLYLNIHVRILTCKNFHWLFASSSIMIGSCFVPLHHIMPYGHQCNVTSPAHHTNAYQLMAPRTSLAWKCDFTYEIIWYLNKYQLHLRSRPIFSKITLTHWSLALILRYEV